jgi:hypothetical protein
MLSKELYAAHDYRILLFFCSALGSASSALRSQRPVNSAALLDGLQSDFFAGSLLHL